MKEILFKKRLLAEEGSLFIYMTIKEPHVNQDCFFPY
jgi:hypothetical protein